jgi:hypothetical protein
MSRGARSSSLVTALVALTGVLLWNLLAGGPQTSGTPPAESPDASQSQRQAGADSDAEGEVASADRGAQLDVSLDDTTRLYAVAVSDLQGLPPNVPPGTRLELWVAWSPPVTKRPRIQRLLREVTLTEIIPAITPDGPDAAMLRLKNSQVADLLYGDQYGSLSVTLLP